MTCAQAQGLIDGGPFVDAPRAVRDAARQHARRCATCGPALEAATALDAGLAALAQPAPPADLTAIVLARIARMDEPGAVAAAVVTERPGVWRGVTGWPAWATAGGGIAAGLAIIAALSQADGAPLDLASFLFLGLTGDLPAPSGAWAVVLVAGLMLYTAGLFASVHGKPPAAADSNARVRSD